MSYMVVNAMWFGTTPNAPSDITLGPISFSYSQIGISLMSAVLTLPLNLTWLTFFRKAKPKTNHDEVIWLIMQKGCSDNDVSDFVYRYFKIHRVIASKIIALISHDAPLYLDTKKCQLPYFFTYIAYVGCFATAAFASVVVLIYGQSFGTAEATKWVTTMILSWILSVFLIEPLKVRRPCSRV